MDPKLTRFQQIYKSRSLRFGGSVEPASLSQRVNNVNEHRRSSRNSVMMSKRKIDVGTLSPIVSPTVNEKRKNEAEAVVKEDRRDTRLEMLRKWQAEKRKRLEQQKATKKPLFKVQHVPDNSQFDLKMIYSQIKGKSIPTSLKYKFKPPANVKPINLKKDGDTATSSSSSNIPKRKAELDPTKRVTRSQKTVTLPALQLPVRTRKAVDTKNTSVQKSQRSRKNQSAVPVSTATSSLSPEYPIISNVSNGESSSSPEPGTPLNKSPGSSNYVSPFVTMSRGKENARKEFRRRSLQGIPKLTDDEDFVPKDVSVQKNRRSRKKQSAVSVSTAASSLAPEYPIITISNVSNGESSSSPEPGTPLNKSPGSSNYVSPFVTMSRGKENARKDFRRRSLRGVPKLTDDEDFVPKDVSVQKNRRSRKNQSAVSVSTSSLSPEYPITRNVSNSESSSSPQPVTPLNKSPGSSIYVSPFVTMSRGKENARKEFHRRSLRGGTDCEGSRDCTSPNAAAAYFYKLLNKQTDRLRILCHKWNTYKDEQKPPEEVCDMIDVAVGQTDLLLNKKFQQFKGLVVACETGNSEKTVTCLDLHGFWDMVMIQVENLDKRFENLDKLQENGWEEILPTPKLNQRNKPKKKAVKKSTTSRSSALKAAIQEARRKKAAEVQLSTYEELILPSTSAETPDTIKSRHSRRNSLRISTLTSTARRTIGSPGLTMMKVTQVAKSAEKSRLVTPTSDCARTSPKSILKSRTSTSVKRKSKVVLFKDNLQLIDDEDEQNNQNVSNMILFSPPVDTPKRRSKRLAKHQ